MCTRGSRLDALGFDSLMYTELGAALEGAGVVLPGVDRLHRVRATCASCTRWWPRAGAPRAGAAAGRRAPRGSRAARAAPAGAADEDLYVPGPVASAGKRGPGHGAAAVLPSGCWPPRSSGASNIPLHTNFIVAANHSSHLDMGLIKVALGDAGRDITSLAAADYFFRNRYRRAYFTNFTNLVPMERAGSIRKSMDTAEQVLAAGQEHGGLPRGHALDHGRLAEFLPSLGYLALRSGVGVLPAYVGGTFQSLPKGAALPRARELGVAFGPFLSGGSAADLTDGPAAAGGVALDRGADPADGREPARRDGHPPGRCAARAGWDGETPGAGRRAARRAPPARWPVS